MVSAKHPPRPAPRRGPRNAPPRRPGRPPAARPAPPPDLRETFATLRGVLARHARHLQVVFDAPDEYTLSTRKAGPDGGPVAFGSVQLQAAP